jgi:hypothetical protein
VPAATLRHHPHASAVLKSAVGEQPMEMGVWLLASEPVAAIDGLHAHLLRVFGGRPARSVRRFATEPEPVPHVA